MIDWINRIRKILRRMPFVDYIFSVLNSLLTLQETGGTFTTTGVENVIIIENSPLVIAKPLRFIVDLTNQAGGDTLVIRVYYRIAPGGALELGQSTSYVGATGGLPNNRVLDDTPLWENRYGIKITEELTAGANFSADWEFVSEA